MTQPSPADLFDMATRSCPYPPGSDSREAWIKGNISNLSALFSQMQAVNQLLRQEEDKYRKARADLLGRMAELQKGCPHEMHRATAECEHQCRWCDFVEDRSPAGYDG